MLYTILYLDLKTSKFEAAYFEGPHERSRVFGAARSKFPNLDNQTSSMIVAILPGKQEVVLPGDFVIDRGEFKSKLLSSI